MSIMIAVSQLANKFSTRVGIAVVLASVGVYKSKIFFKSTRRSAEKNQTSGTIWGDSGLDKMLPNEETNGLRLLAERVLPRCMHNWVLPPLLYFAGEGRTLLPESAQSFAKLLADLANAFFSYGRENQDDAPLQKDKINAVASQVRHAVVHISLPEGDNEVAVTGIIFDKDGLILTWARGLASTLYRKVHVSLSDRRTFEGIVISVRKKFDIAFVKINPYSPLPTATFRSSCTLRPGDWIVAVGSPIPYEINATSHRVSGGTENKKKLQMHGSISVENSGGPLLDESGQIVGLNTLSYVLPIKRVHKCIQQFLREWRPQRNWFGFEMANIKEVNFSLKEGAHLEFPDDEGVIITKVEQGSPAQCVGLRAGDVVLEFGGKKISRAVEIVAMMKKIKPTPVKVSVKRGTDAPIYLTLTPPYKKG